MPEATAERYANATLVDVFPFFLPSNGGLFEQAVNPKGKDLQEAIKR